MSRIVYALAAVALALNAQAAYPQPTAIGQQVIAALRPQCNAQREAAISTITGSNTPEGRVTIGGQLDAYTDAQMTHDPELLVERDLPDLVRKTASDAPRAPQYRYLQCLLVARARQLASNAPGIPRPAYESFLNFGQTTKSFLINDLRQFCQAERQYSEQRDREFERSDRAGRYPHPDESESNARQYEFAVNDDEAQA